MLPPRCSSPPCMNMDVKRVSHVAGRSLPAPEPQTIWEPSGKHWSPGWEISYG